MKDDPDLDVSLRSPSNLAKTVFWLTLAAPGIWLALQMPTRGDHGEGYVQFAIMGASLVVAAVVTEVLWHVVGPGGRALLRNGVGVA